MIDKPATNIRLDHFRQRVALRELEFAAQYPRARTSAYPIRDDKGSGTRSRPMIEWPGPAVMPSEMELHDFVGQHPAKRLEDLPTPAGVADSPAQKD